MRIRSVAVSVLLMGALTSGATGSPGASAGPDDGTAAADLLGDITFSVPGGAFTDRIEVALATDVAGAEIRYTTDGELPDPTSTRYSGSPVVLTAPPSYGRSFATAQPQAILKLPYWPRRSPPTTTCPRCSVSYAAGEPRKADGCGHRGHGLRPRPRTSNLPGEP